MLYAPGQSGNAGNKRERLFYSALSRAIAQEDAKRVRAAAEQLLDLAASGEAWAIKELADRLDGKAMQDTNTNLSGDFSVRWKK